MIDNKEGDVYFIGAYEGVLEKAIKLLKFRLKKRIARYLSDIMANHNPFRDFDLIIPVPLHKHRLDERGFNQSELIAAEISKRSGAPLVGDCLIRIKDTKHQFELGRAERLSNLNGAFAINDPQTVKGKRILLIDDIYTTGSTIGECRRCLLESGAGPVNSLILSRPVSL